MEEPSPASTGRRHLAQAITAGLAQGSAGSWRRNY